MISNSDDRLIARAIEEARYSPCKVRHGCVASINGKYIASGHNHFRLRSNNNLITHPCSCHAEIDVLHKCLKLVKKQNLKKLTFYIVRLSSLEKIKGSAPCIDCGTKLSEYNIKKIIYQPTCNFDYAFVHINEWKENSSSLIESIYYHKEANINMNRNGNYWIFTPIENYPNNYISFNKNEYENKHILRELLH